MNGLDETLQQAARRKNLPDPAIRRLLRERAGLTQAELAAAIGVSRVAVSRYETGQRRPRGRLALYYAAALDRLMTEVAR